MQALGNALNQTTTHPTAPVILVMGARNMGKSTFTRCLINTLLHSAETRVGYVECDLGQTEFTPPGCVSYKILSEFILGIRAPRSDYLANNETLYL